MTDNYAALLRQTTKAYRESLAAPETDDMFTLAYQWQDKKHRHVWDLCKELERAADRIEKLEAEEEEWTRICNRYADHYAARIEKLEAALRTIADIEHEDLPKPTGAAEGTLWVILTGCVEVAEKALEGKDV